jgi:hypothetical protein
VSGDYSAAGSDDARHDGDSVCRRIGDVVADEGVGGRGVIAKAAAQLRPGANSGRRSDRKRAGRAQHRALSEHLHPVADQATILADGGAAGAAELDVGLAAIARVWSDFKGHDLDSRVTAP